jgi:hypothetical protein
MLKLIRFIGLVSQAIFLQFVHLFGLVGLLAGIAIGYFRLPSWIVPIVAVVCGVIADKYVDLKDITGLLDKASAASERGGFMIVVYFVIVAVGYLLGAYGRHYLNRAKAPRTGKKV